MAEVHGNRTTAENAEDITVPRQSGAESGAVGAREVPDDPALWAVIDAWPTLPEAVKQGIATLIESAGNQPDRAAHLPDRS